jgi:hypothetical protein
MTRFDLSYPGAKKRNMEEVLAVRLSSIRKGWNSMSSYLIDMKKLPDLRGLVHALKV